MLTLLAAFAAALALVGCGGRSSPNSTATSSSTTTTKSTHTTSSHHKFHNSKPGY